MCNRRPACGRHPIIEKERRTRHEAKDTDIAKMGRSGLSNYLVLATPSDLLIWVRIGTEWAVSREFGALRPELN